MAIKGTEAAIIVGAFLMSSQSNSVNVAVNTTEGECTNFDSDGVETQSILSAMNIEHNGYLVDVKGQGDLEKEMEEALGSGTENVTVIFGKSTAGAPAYFFHNASASNMTYSMPATALMAINGSWGIATEPYYRGVTLAYNVTVVSTGGRTSVDIGSAGTAGGKATLHVHSKTGTITNGTIDVESALTEGGTYSSEGTFTFSSVVSQNMTLSNGINRWLRINTTSMGGATNFTVTVVCAVKGVTYDEA